MDAEGRIRATFTDPTGGERDDWEAPIPQDLEALTQVWPDLAEAINAVRDDERKG